MQYYDTYAIQADSCPAGSVPLDAEHSAAAEKCPCFTHFVNHVVRQLIDNLVDKSRTYLSKYYLPTSTSYYVLLLLLLLELLCIHELPYRFMLLLIITVIATGPADRHAA
jgi:hypothetical protein